MPQSSAIIFLLVVLVLVVMAVAWFVSWALSDLGVCDEGLDFYRFVDS